MMGLGVAIPRFSSLNTEKKTYFLSGIVLILFFSLLLMLILNLGAPLFSELFFGEVKYVRFIFPLTLLLIGFGVHAILYGFLRGRQTIYLANIIQLINVGIIPVLVFFLADDVEDLIYWNSLLMLLVCLLAGILVVRRFPSDWKIADLKTDAKELLRYGLPRVPGDFALLALLTLPTYLSLQINHDIVLAGEIAYSITLLNMAGAAFGPISLVLLPEIARFLTEKNTGQIRKRFRVFVALSLGLTTFGYLIFYFFNELVFRILLGNKVSSNIDDICIIMLLSVFGYSLFVVLRSFLDAIKVTAVNAFNLLIALGTYLLLVAAASFWKLDSSYYLIAFVVSMTLLGLLTLIKTYFTLKKLEL